MRWNSLLFGFVVVAGVVGNCSADDIVKIKNESGIPINCQAYQGDPKKHSTFIKPQEIGTLHGGGNQVTCYFNDPYLNSFFELIRDARALRPYLKTSFVQKFVTIEPDSTDKTLWHFKCDNTCNLMATTKIKNGTTLPLTITHWLGDARDRSTTTLAPGATMVKPNDMILGNFSIGFCFAENYQSKNQICNLIWILDPNASDTLLFKNK